MRKYLYFALGLLVVGIDQSVKLYLLSHQILPIYYNRNVGFSLPVPWYLPWALIVVGLIYIYFREIEKIKDFFLKTSQLSYSTLLYSSLSFIIGGGISNVIDRIIHNGAVIDFIDVHFWPVFNIADSAICIGGVLLIIYYFKYSHKRGEL